MIKVNIINDINSINYKPLFKEILKTTLKTLSIRNRNEINVYITNNDKIHEYNLKYRNIDKETDVLSFPSDEKNEIGDLIISFEKATLQAEEYGHSIAREMGFLFLHGLLHCLGYDHMNETEEKEMFSMQDIILNKINLGR